MTGIDFDKLPTFSDLPVKSGVPADSNWGVFGDDDELGSLNFLTEPGVVEAARLVRKGKVFRLDMPIGYASTTLFERPEARHTIVPFEGELGHDDQLDNYNTQEGTQWDGLGHQGDQDAGTFYNGVKQEQIKSGPDGKLGIQLWANKMVGRGVLIDAFKYRNDQGRPLDPSQAEWYTLDDLQGTVKAQGVQLKPGDMLLVRTGWMRRYMGLSTGEKDALGNISDLTACGIDSAREVAAWLWDNRVSALAADCPSVEIWPFNTERGPLHVRTLAWLGLPLGEQFNLEGLATDSEEDGVYESMVVSVPLNLEGGIASPPNAVAIK